MDIGRKLQPEIQRCIEVVDFLMRSGYTSLLYKKHISDKWLHLRTWSVGSISHIDHWCFIYINIIRSMMSFLYTGYVYSICIPLKSRPQYALKVKFSCQGFQTDSPKWSTCDTSYQFPSSLSAEWKKIRPPFRSGKTTVPPEIFFLAGPTELAAAPVSRRGKRTPHLKWKKWCGETLQHGVRLCIPAVSEYQVLVGLGVECRVCLDSTISQPSEAPLDWTLGWFVRITACERDTWGWKEREKRAMKHDLWLSELCGGES